MTSLTDLSTHLWSHPSATSQSVHAYLREAVVDPIVNPTDPHKLSGIHVREGLVANRGEPDHQIPPVDLPVKSVHINTRIDFHDDNSVVTCIADAGNRSATPAAQMLKLTPSTVKQQ